MRSVPNHPYSLIVQPEWMEDAACNNEDPELFYLDSEDSRADQRAQEAEAKAVCRRCDVKTQCLNWAIESGERWAIAGEENFASRKTRTRLGILFQGPGKTFCARGHKQTEAGRCMKCHEEVNEPVQQRRYGQEKVA